MTRRRSSPIHRLDHRCRHGDRAHRRPSAGRRLARDVNWPPQSRERPSSQPLQRCGSDGAAVSPPPSASGTGGTVQYDHDVGPPRPAIGARQHDVTPACRRSPDRVVLAPMCRSGRAQNDSTERRHLAHSHPRITAWRYSTGRRRPLARSCQRLCTPSRRPCARVSPADDVLSSCSPQGRRPMGLPVGQGSRSSRSITQTANGASSRTSSSPSTVPRLQISPV